MKGPPSLGYVDSHSHLSDLRLESEVEAMIQSAKLVGIEMFLQGGVGPEDWERQRALSLRHPEILLCFGLHPYWVIDHSMEQCEEGLDLLARQIAQASALGELGLDFRPHLVKDSRERQLEVFEAQLELAEIAAKPIVLHLVRAFPEALQIFETRGVPRAGGMVHSFNGNIREAEAYLKLNLHLSIGGPVVRPENKKLHEAVKLIPWSSLMLETDSPDQPPPSRQGGLNEPQTLLEVAETIAQLKGSSTHEVLDITSRNLRQMLSLS
ncbi:MAG: TatD family deoxyribonuclease [Bdellovibrio sp. CG10_big_fil_rev_8_21_14_0_10_47_8]|nr:MAG: TatD family deoxyribonuclease [Bdellovibrio sp. CG10_big_fil_rev_8_21_14_0_10_47_8]